MLAPATVWFAPACSGLLRLAPAGSGWLVAFLLDIVLHNNLICSQLNNLFYKQNVYHPAFEQSLWLFYH
jgi:hypothetical protein